MDTPAASPQVGDVDVSGLRIQPQPSASLSWITFGGSPGESPTLFVRSIQRLAFQQDRVDDDRWIAHYVSTCFDGDALLWYSELDEQIQSSWRSIRIALLRRYPPTTGTGVLSVPGLALSPASTTVTAKSSGEVGFIGLVGEHTLSFGYIFLDVSTGFGITSEKDKALQVVVPTAHQTDILQLRMANVPIDDKFPYLGLALFEGMMPEFGSPGFKLFEGMIVPPPLTGITQITDHRDRTYERNVPRPSRKCGGTQPNSRDSSGRIATWILAACGESMSAGLYRRGSASAKAGERVVAAAWKYNKNTEELTMTWAMDDESECELGAYLPEKERCWPPPSKSEGLHFHRPSDMTPANVGKYIEEMRVRFVFHPAF